MQKRDNNQIIYSSYDLVTFLKCNHASFLDLKALNGELETAETDTKNFLPWKKMAAAKEDCLQQQQSKGKSRAKTVAEIPKENNLEEKAALTLEAMKSGADIISQPVFYTPPWRENVSFLVKSDTPSNLGNYSYEALSVKLAHAALSQHIIQLCVCSELLGKLQDKHPKNMHLFLGDGETHSFLTADFFHYYLHNKERFERFVESPPPNSYPQPCSHCSFCKWRNKCKAQWEADDDLSLVANIRRSQASCLRKEGICTVAALATTPPNANIPNLSRNAFLRLRAQAELQHHKAVTGEDKHEIILPMPGKGFARMPFPNEGDLFFDIESDPFYPEGLSYLLGIYHIDDGENVYIPFWAHDHKEEKEALKSFMDFLDKHLTKNPYAHIYHYNDYETKALKRLVCRYAVCEEQLDNLLRRQKFVDLYWVVRESVRTSAPGYALKKLESFYMEAQNDTNATAADIVRMYTEWQETGNDELLQKISNYNESDCIRAYRLREWLLSIKPENTPLLMPESATEHKLQRKDWERQYEEYQKRLGLADGNPTAINRRIAHLLEFHNREAKPQWWAAFERQKKFEDELVDDIECIGQMRKQSDTEHMDGYRVSAYTFPSQEYKLKIGSQPVVVESMESVGGKIIDIDEKERVIKIKRGINSHDLPEHLSIGPTNPINTRIIRDAIYHYADQMLNKPDEHRAATELLLRNTPRIKGKQEGDEIVSASNLQEDSLKAIAAMEKTCLFVQGPPGAGKTYTSSHIIVDLIKRGKKVGITSNSHKAIHNVLEKIEKVAEEKGVHFHGVKKATRGNDESFYEGKFINSVQRNENMDIGANLFAGTAWTFSDGHFENRLDYLFIDEAGQVSIANVVAMSTAAKNVVLVGDQMQLGQPIQGIHPGDAGMSVLEFLLRKDLAIPHSTIPPERGIFLQQTRRMRPKICKFISDAFYDGRLTSHTSALARSLNLQGVDLPNEGIVVIPAEHDGCSQKSEEEGEIIKTKYMELLGQSFTDQNGKTRPINEDDILVVSPYNMQVNHLRQVLPEKAKIGTVDKFQGQEAPIVLISMATSSAEYLPRKSIQFLYSKNRLNVAISRAQCLAIMVANPKLLEVSCDTTEQMNLVNTFCWLDKYSK